MDNTPLLKEYYAQNAKKIRNMVDKILSGFGGVTQKDYDDFYSLANEVFVDMLRRYDRKQRFDSFLYSCLSNRIKTYRYFKYCPTPEIQWRTETGRSSRPSPVNTDNKA